MILAPCSLGSEKKNLILFELKLKGTADSILRFCHSVMPSDLPHYSAPQVYLEILLHNYPMWLHNVIPLRNAAMQLHSAICQMILPINSTLWFYSQILPHDYALWFFPIIPLDNTAMQFCCVICPMTPPSIPLSDNTPQFCHMIMPCDSAPWFHPAILPCCYPCDLPNDSAS